jgi:hypothetical protein
LRRLTFSSSWLRLVFLIISSVLGFILYAILGGLGRRLGRTESCRRDCHSHFLPKSFAGAYRWPRCHVLVRDVAAA